MDLLKTILIYMSMVFISSVQTAPEEMPPPLVTIAPSAIVQANTPTPVPTPTPTPVPTPDITPNTTYKTIQVGDKGDGVQTLQRRLAELGYYTGDIDGRYGNQTRRAVERFQYYHGLSADGIAGKRTLTVLYESKDVVFAPVDVTPTPKNGVTATPSVGLTDKPAAARTLQPGDSTPAPTFFPTPTPPVAGQSDAIETTGAPVAALDDESTDVPATREAILTPKTDAPTATPQEGTPKPTGPIITDMEGYSFLLDGQDEPLVGVAEEGQEPSPLSPLLLDEKTVMVPLLRVLMEANIVMIPAEEEQHAEYAFAIKDDLYRLSFNIDANGNPTGLAIYKNSEPQLMQIRVALLQDGILYLPLEDTQKWTGIAFTLDDESKIYTVSMPQEP